jgi:hypothetical protein
MIYLIWDPSTEHGVTRVALAFVTIVQLLGQPDLCKAQTCMQGVFDSIISWPPWPNSHNLNSSSLVHIPSV